MIAAGELRHVITIQERAETTDAYGGTVYIWSDFATVRAKVQPLRGRELIAAQAAQNQTTVKFYIRYLAGIDSTMRLVWDGNNYDIEPPVDVNGQGRVLEIMAKTGMSTG